MSAHRRLSDFISAHRAAILIDEASFDDDGKALDAAQAEKTGNAERAAFIEFVSVPCTSPEEVQAKLRYLLDGTVGERDTHMDCLIDYGDTLLGTLLRSLVLEDVTDNMSIASRGSRTCTREEE